MLFVTEFVTGFSQNRKIRIFLVVIIYKLMHVVQIYRMATILFWNLNSQNLKGFNYKLILSLTWCIVGRLFFKFLQITTINMIKFARATVILQKIVNSVDRIR